MPSRLICLCTGSYPFIYLHYFIAILSIRSVYAQLFHHVQLFPASRRAVYQHDIRQFAGSRHHEPHIFRFQRVSAAAAEYIHQTRWPVHHEKVPLSIQKHRCGFYKIIYRSDRLMSRDEFTRTAARYPAAFRKIRRIARYDIYLAIPDGFRRKLRNVRLHEFDPRIRDH